MCRKTPLKLSHFLPYRLSVLSNTISRKIAESYEAEFGLTMGQWRIMAILGEADGLTATQLCQRTAMDKVAVSRAVSALVQSNRVEKTVAAADARQAHLSLTKEGLDVYHQIVPQAILFERTLLSDLSDDEITALDHLLGRIATATSPEQNLW